MNRHSIEDFCRSEAYLLPYSHPVKYERLIDNAMNRISEKDLELLRAFEKWQKHQMSHGDLHSILRDWIKAKRQPKHGMDLDLSLGDISLDESFADNPLRSIAQRAADLSEIESVRRNFSSAIESLGEIPHSLPRESVWMRCGTTLSDDTFGGGRYAYYEPPVRSGEAEIWKAIDLKSVDPSDDTNETSRKRTVALKRPTRFDLESSNAVEAENRLLNEAKRAALLEHSNICPVYDIFEGSSTQPPFYTMRFLGGKTLREVIQSFHSEKPVSVRPKEDWQELIGFLVDAASGVAHAHSQGFAHLDIKPANVSIGDQGDALVIDWGMASRLQGPASETSKVEEGDVRDATSTRLAGTTYGTPAYAAPEQMLGNPCGVFTDVFQLGSVLYECLSGDTPFGDPSIDVAVLKSALNVRHSLSNDKRFPHLQRNQLSVLVKVCDKAMESNPTDRYKSVDEFRHDLQAWLNDLPISVGVERIGTKIARAYRKNRTSILSSFLVNLTLVAAGLVTVWLLWNQIADYRKSIGEARKELTTTQEKTRESFLKNYRSAIRKAGEEFSANRLEEATRSLSVAKSSTEFTLGDVSIPLGREYHLMSNLTTGYSEVDAELLADNPHKSRVVHLKSLLNGNVLSLSADGLLVWWDGNSQKQIRSLQLSVKPNDTFINQGYNEQEMTSFYTLRKQIFEPGAPIAISQDETNIAIAVERRNRLPEVQAFNLLTGEMVMRFPCAVDQPRSTLKIHSLDFSPDGSRIVVGTNQRSWLLSYPSKEVVSELSRKSSEVPQRSFAFDRTGNRIIGLDAGSGLGYWNTESLSQSMTSTVKAKDDFIRDRGMINSIFFEDREPPVLISPKNDQFVTFGPRGIFQYPIDLSLPNGDRGLANSTLSTLSRSKTTCCAYSPDGMLIAAFDVSRKSICIYSALTGVELRSHPCPTVDSPTSVCFVEGNRSVWLAENTSVFRIDLSKSRSTGKPKTPLVTGPAIPCLKRQSADDSIFGYSIFGIPRIWKYSETNGQELLRNGASATPTFQLIQSSPNSKTFATCTSLLDSDKVEVEIFDSQSGEKTHRVEIPHAGQLGRIAWSADSNHLVAYQDGTPSTLNTESILEDYVIPDNFVLDTTTYKLVRLKRLPFFCTAFIPDPIDGSMLAVGRSGILRMSKDFEETQVVASLSLPSNHALMSIDYSPTSQQLALRIDEGEKKVLIRRFDFGTKSFLSDIVLERSSSGKYSNKISFDSSGDYLSVVLNDSDVAVINLARNSEITHLEFAPDKSILSLVSRLEPAAWMMARVLPLTNPGKRDLAGEVLTFGSDTTVNPSIVSTTLPLPRIAEGTFVGSSMIVGNFFAGATSRVFRKDDGTWESVAFTEAKPFRTTNESAIIDMAINESLELAVLARLNGSIELCDFPSFKSRWIKDAVYAEQQINAMFLTQVAFSESDSCIVVGAPNMLESQVELKCLDLLGEQIGESTFLSAGGMKWSLAEKGNFVGFVDQANDAELGCVVHDRRKNIRFNLVAQNQNGSVTCLAVDETADVVAFNEMRRLAQNNTLTGYQEIVHVFRLSAQKQLASLLVKERFLKNPVSGEDPDFLSKEQNFDNPISKLAISPDGRTVAARRIDGGKLYLWDITNASLAALLDPTLELTSPRTAYNPWSPLGFDRAGDRLLEGIDRAIEVFDFRQKNK